MTKPGSAASRHSLSAPLLKLMELLLKDLLSQDPEAGDEACVCV
jgi:hypothetical protein